MSIPAAILALLSALAVLASGLDLSALRKLYRSCSRRVMAVALHLLRDRGEAEDVVQETFLELWRRAPANDPARGSPEAWAVLIARSRALDRLRARGSARRAADLAAAEPVLRALRGGPPAPGGRAGAPRGRRRRPGA